MFSPLEQFDVIPLYFFSYKNYDLTFFNIFLPIINIQTIESTLPTTINYIPAYFTAPLLENYNGLLLPSIPINYAAFGAFYSCFMLSQH